MMSELSSLSSLHANVGYLVQGSGNAVVLLHSSMSSKSQWNALAARLGDRHRVISIDLYGYGDVPMPAEVANYRLAAEVARVKAVLQRELAPAERFHLAGHSFGGAVALRLAHAERQRIRSVALFEPTAFHLLSKDAGALVEVTDIAQVVKQGLAAGDVTAAARSFIDFWSGPGAFDQCSPSRQAQFSAQLRKVDLDFDALINDAHTAQDYAAIASPLLLLLGRQGRDCTRAIAAELARRHTSCTVREIDGGHMAPVTHRDAVNAEFDAFISMIEADALRARA